jgi:hypothetical protein
MGSPFLVDEMRSDTFTILCGRNKLQSEMSVNEFLLKAFVL